MSEIRFDGRVAIVTGGGNGLGRSHALALASRGARLVVNDMGGSVDGVGSGSAAEDVAAEIRAAGGEAISHTANVTREDEVADMVAQAMKAFGQVDILVNNAGILRDKSFAKMDMADFNAVTSVHLTGSAICTKALWDHMRERQYGRIVMTSSSSGIYGNFGQANYGAAKMGLVGFMNVLHLEGAKYGIRVNALSPTAATRMTEGLIPEEALKLMTVESVSAGLVYLVSDDAPSRLVLCAGAGGYAATRVYETDGIYLPPEQQTPEHVAANIDAIIDPAGQQMFEQGGQQTMKFLAKAAAHFGVKLG
ncbi:SDR family NAD(P)-dependent oxidoreductase [Maricaulis salignorans]|uniref:NAD(P)-dependent dehydrogenase, short-chain alcohol dehydrogenase family n=1 Tax=Maricaulis salignorans TaxID=144026 RepID=A0A1G9TP30_9PROT|nr:SDR family NAD(P)-dependent oxidoreductase [Maricaulis salignorans]SDM49402.1 NAD(P)-dependent dehydrogenase, short-chain alcohol dehydrogenase family [Maricaulis salignorans]